MNRSIVYFNEVFMKKLVSLIMALVMILSLLALVACNNDEPSKPNEPGKDNPSTPSTGDDDSKDDDSTERIALELPDAYYGGSKQFHILEWSANGVDEVGNNWIPWEEGAVSDEAGDLMSNAVFARNAYVEEKFGVKITSEYVSVNQGYTQRMTQDAQTYSNEFQLATMRSVNVWSLIEAGLYLDMNEYAGEILHTDQPWWVPDAVESYTLGDGLYVCATEMLLRDKGATAALYFNTKLASDYGLNSLYDLVESGMWTLEDMIGACDVVATSLDGNDLIDSGRDCYGIVAGDDPLMLLYGASGNKFAHVDDDGKIVYDFGDKTSIDVIQTIFEDVMYADWYHNTYCDGTLENEPEDGMFKSDLQLFNASLVKVSYIDLRDMETEYGILPMPKYDVMQEDYSSLVWVHHDCVVGIPSAAADPEMCAIILEALSYEGYYTVTPVLYETLLLNRLAKSPEAKRSFEIIFETRSYDPGQYWDLAGGFQNKLLRNTATHTSNVSSVWEQNRSATEEQIKLVNEFIDATR